MKKLLIAAAALLAATAARGADMVPRTYTKAPAIPVSNWTGFYAGANVGYAWGDPSIFYAPNNSVIAGSGSAFPTGSWDNSGALGGAQLGFNWHVNPQWVTGIEADIDASGIKGSNASAGVVGFGAASFTTSQKVDWFGTVRGRLGFLPTDRLLIYGTGGLAYGEIKEDTSLTRSTGLHVTGGGFGVSCTANQTCFAGSTSGVRTGWTAGAGFEYALLQNVSVKTEYLYVDLGGNSVIGTAFNGNGQKPASYTATISGLNFNIVRAGLNYRF
ncbi:MAG: porin family protein [Bradyrhizobiaceae bacterium]|nr:MAG: porin family protein [Bradyrhizobiaceae bacterium]